MSEPDDKIREALSAQDAEILDEYRDEPSMVAMVFEVFRGRHRWLVICMNLVSVAMLVLAIVAAVQFFKVETTREMIAWAVGFLFCISAMSMLKLWFWLEMQKNSITREVKRLELQIARLAGRLESPDSGE